MSREFRLLRPITPGGWLAIMLASVLAAIAVRAFNPWLLLVACALASPVLLAQFLRPDLRSVSVSFRSPRRLVAGDQAEQVLTVRNDGPRSLPGLGVLHLCPGLAPIAFSVPPLASGCQAEFVFDRRAVRRGRAVGHEIRLGTTAPFGMAHHTRRIRVQAELVVHPARVPAVEIASGHLTPEDAGGARAVQPGSEPHALREWRHGDDLRHVNWRATARRPLPEQLIVVVPEPEVETSLMLVVTGAAEDEDWEDLVRLAAWSACAAAGTHADVTLLAPGVPAWTGTDELEILDWFSTLTGEGSAPDETASPDGVDVAEFQHDVRTRSGPGVIVVEATTRPFGLHQVPAGGLLRGISTDAVTGTTDPTGEDPA
ncbi:DUF58 domain-containing protein [Kineosporia sp. J2-2]|uniref:DUF58 domain-containing protein n=1 Tax=Kineosporia corallincola TaxID=2835133 RepID=A0ABS5TJQ2_9ACTN|nr:DUF58 domain-containing protein [Kineosporia corallincola]MBT0771322.1 DUF58 domain-containing protein [Kineosporia corallincola]